MSASLVGSEMCIRDRLALAQAQPHALAHACACVDRAHFGFKRVPGQLGRPHELSYLRCTSLRLRRFRGRTVSRPATWSEIKRGPARRTCDP
eukprot:3381629-Alexandrium_andersonii.AAC.1